ncbi:hypothetical protein HPB50_017761 [Hyalomma asiaticum]|uniref:Uncharacterized protein n=1 Tax=Hyalomma asiaticum TaxID=266040 RepID=A0ACB7S4G5_HYAAI|nr:hypothetical protein HPB50_017761 [Hyalomma asiaticum]
MPHTPAGKCAQVSSTGPRFFSSAVTAFPMEATRCNITPGSAVHDYYGMDPLLTAIPTPDARDAVTASLALPVWMPSTPRTPQALPQVLPAARATPPRSSRVLSSVSSANSTVSRTATLPAGHFKAMVEGPAKWRDTAPSPAIRGAPEFRRLGHDPYARVESINAIASRHARTDYWKCVLTIANLKDGA